MKKKVVMKHFYLSQNNINAEPGNNLFDVRKGMLDILLNEMKGCQPLQRVCK